MFTKFKGIFSSKQSSGKADEYFGSSKSKKKHVIIGQSDATHDGWAVSHLQCVSNLMLETFSEQLLRGVAACPAL